MQYRPMQGGDMITTLKFWPMACASAILLAGCVMGGVPMQPGAPHLSATQCRDLTAIRNHEPTTFRQNQSELAALETAGYDPSPFYDPYYPDDLQAAQRLVDYWYQTECQSSPG
jgi:hypothetical protein